jgi:hypothetical protein
MISKTILVFWTVTCFMIAAQVISTDTTGGGTMFVIILQGIIWGIVAVPTALIGALFKKNKEPKSYEKYVLIGAAVGAFILCTSALDWKRPTSKATSSYSATTHYRR